MPRTREEWADWLHDFAYLHPRQDECCAIQLNEKADELLKAIADERERAVEECAKLVEVRIDHHNSSCDAEVCEHCATNRNEAEIARLIRRLNRQRESGQ